MNTRKLFFESLKSIFVTFGLIIAFSSYICAAYVDIDETSLSPYSMFKEILPLDVQFTVGSSRVDGVPWAGNPMFTGGLEGVRFFPGSGNLGSPTTIFIGKLNRCILVGSRNQKWLTLNIISGACRVLAGDNRTFSVSEINRNGPLVDTVASNDRDVGDSLNFSITGGAASTGRAVYASTVAIKLTDVSQFNFEMTPGFILNEASDSFFLTDLGSISTNINNIYDIPTVKNDQTFLMEENGAVRATVGMVASSVANADDRLSFSNTTGGAGSTECAVNVLEVAIRADIGQLDFRTVISFILNEGADSHLLADSGSMSIHLNDVNDMGVGTDADTSLGLSITGGTGSAECAVYPSTVAIRLTDVSQLDFETVNSFIVNEGANSHLLMTNSGSMSIHLNDVNDILAVNDPIFAVERVPTRV